MSEQEVIAEYNRNYYQNHYKNIIANKFVHCECCDQDIKAWNYSRHRNSKKYQFNILDESGKFQALEIKKKNKILKEIKKLERKVKHYESLVEE